MLITFFMTLPFPLNKLIISILLYTIPVIIVWYGHKRLKTDTDKTASKIRFYAAILLAFAFAFTITMMILVN
jgi:hypothetical protein